MRDWGWLHAGLRFGLYNGNPLPVGGGYYSPVEHRSGYTPGAHPSHAYPCDTLRCNNGSSSNPNETIGYDWNPGLQEYLFGDASGSQTEWTIALTMNTYKALAGVYTIFEVWKSVSQHLLFSVHPNLLEWPGFYLELKVNSGVASLSAVLDTVAEREGLFGRVYEATEFPVVMTMNTVSGISKIYVHGVLAGTSVWAVAPWVSTQKFIFGCSNAGTPAESNDGNYAVFLISDFEWNAEQALDWSNDPTGWAELYRSLVSPVALWDEFCVHADIELSSVIGVNTKGFNRVGADLKMQSPVDTNIWFRNN